MGVTCGQWNVCRGWRRAIKHRKVSRNPAEDPGEGSLALWPMIKPDSHAAGVKRVELHPSGSWCNDIRNVEISVLV